MSRLERVMSIAPAALGPASPRDENEPTVFVIELLGSPAFAFEAKSIWHADELARSPWFTRALDDFCLRRDKTEAAIISLRAATGTEASIYQDLACEFASETNDFLVLHLSSRES
jgi:hypothetical protein